MTCNTNFTRDVSITHHLIFSFYNKFATISLKLIEVLKSRLVQFFFRKKFATKMCQFIQLLNVQFLEVVFITLRILKINATKTKSPAQILLYYVKLLVVIYFPYSCAKTTPNEIP